MNADGLRLATRGDALIANPTGEIDLSNADQLANRVVEAARPECPAVVLDLSEVEFMDSFGIYVTIGMSRRLAEHGQSLAVVVPPGSPVLGTLRISNVGSLVPIFDSLDAALSELAAAHSAFETPKSG